MKVALAQLNYHIGNFEYNTQKIINSIEEAKVAKADLVVFSELAICGYPPRDFLEFNHFVELCQKAVQTIAKQCVGITVIVGAPSVNPKLEGKHLFNSAYVLENKAVKSIHHKTLLPTYDVFDEHRYFEPSQTFECAEINGQKIALTICEDIWDVEENELYNVQPMAELGKQHPTLAINIAASPFNYKRAKKRRQIITKNVERYALPMIYVNHVGAQTELVFDGGSMVMNSAGEIARQMPFFEEGMAYVETNNLIEEPTEIPEEITLIHDAIVLGIRDYFQKLGFKKAVLGLSGGIDSAVTLVLAVKALGAENVKAVMMPSQYSSDHSVSDSEQLIQTLGCERELISIKDIYGSIDQTLNPVFGDVSFDLTEENIQARIRGLLLMAISNKQNYILLNTSNKSENAVGYGTLYGDMCGGLGVIGDVYKTKVFALARYMNRNKEVVPENIITKPPSAELRPNQKDSDSLPDYDLLDELLYQYIEERKDPNELIAQGFDEALVAKILKMVNRVEFKRYQTPPILRVTTKAFGMGRRMPIVAKYLG